MDVEWRAFVLHPGIPPQGQPIPWDPARRAAGRAAFERLARQAGLAYGERTHWYNSLPAHEAATWAHRHYPPEVEEAFRRAVFQAYFVHGLNIGEPPTLVALAADQALDGDDLRAALAEGRYRDAVAAEVDAARADGVDGVPTAIAGGYAVVGAQPYEVFQQLMAVTGTRRNAPP